MPIIKIDNLEYNSEDLSDAGLSQLNSLQFLETQMLQLQNEIAVYQTATNAYLAALKSDIENSNVQSVEVKAEYDEWHRFQNLVYNFKFILYLEAG